jgi:predicted dehydrogenase
MSSRRKFIKQLGSTVSLLSASSLTSLAAREQHEQRILAAEKKLGSNDNVNVAIIGMGIIGFRNGKTMLQIPGVKIVACCDLYQGRLDRSKEVFGKDVFITRDYLELLNRKDIDAVIVCTSDNWHDRISIDAMRKGKAVYCEKPMVHKLSEGLEVIKVQQQTKAIMQVGSQRVSSIAYAKAKELVKAGEIGELNCVEASFDRQSALGAWQYTMPLDANEQTIDWKKYNSKNPASAFNAKQFFWWRNYKNFGTGMAGDLFVHLLSGLHFLTDSKGPSKIYAMGNLGFWKDGRDVPDVMTAVLHYPETPQHKSFELTLRANFVSGQVDKMTTKYIGSEGVLDFGWNDFTIKRNKMPKAPGIGGWDAMDTYTEAAQKDIRAAYEKKYAEADRKATTLPSITYAAPDGYSDSLDHFIHFFESIRQQKPVVEDASFGFRTAAPCLACNESYYTNKVINWDAEKMMIKG